MNVMTVTDGMTDAPAPVKTDSQSGDTQGFASELNKASNAGNTKCDGKCDGKAEEVKKTADADQPEDHPVGPKDEKDKNKDTDQPQAAITLQGPISAAILVQAVQDTDQTDTAGSEAQEDTGTVVLAQAQTVIPTSADQLPQQIAAAGQTVTVNTAEAGMPVVGDGDAQETAVQAGEEPKDDKAQAFANQVLKEVKILSEAAKEGKEPKELAETQASQPAEVQQETTDVRTRVMQRMQAEQTDQHQQAEKQAEAQQNVKGAADVKTAADDAKDNKKGNSLHYQKQDANGVELQTPAWAHANGNTTPVQFKVPQAEQSAVQKNIVTTIVDNIKTAANKGQTELVVQLKPEHLGGLEISLTMGDSGLTAKMVTGQESVQNMIHNQMALLQDTLREKGIPVVHMEVVYDQTQNNMSFSHNGNQGQWTAQGGNGNGHSYRDTEDSVNYYNFMSSYEVLAEHGGSVEFSA